MKMADKQYNLRLESKGAESAAFIFQYQNFAAAVCTVAGKDLSAAEDFMAEEKNDVNQFSIQPDFLCGYLLRRQGCAR